MLDNIYIFNAALKYTKPTTLCFIVNNYCGKLWKNN